jgi:hypothetical protein
LGHQAEIEREIADNHFQTLQAKYGMEMDETFLSPSIPTRMSLRTLPRPYAYTAISPKVQQKPATQK